MEKRKQASRIWLGLLTAVIVLTTSYYAYADSLSDLKQQQEEAESEAAELKKAKQQLEEQLSDLNSELYRISKDISTLEDEIAECESQIAQAQEELEEAEAAAQQQYDEMKLRIQYMYENSSGSMLTTLLGAEGITDFINRVEYMAEMSNYDRTMLDVYEDTQERIAKHKATLEEQQAILLADQEKLEEEQQKLLASISETKTDIASADEGIDAQQAKAEELSEQISAMEEYERKLEEQRAKEEAARIAAQKKKEEEEARRKEEEQKKSEQNDAKDTETEEESETEEETNNGTGKDTPTSVSPTTASASEEELLAALIYCESGGESYESQLAVGSVVLNRVKSSSFPNSITGVIYQSGQFSPAASGKLALVLENGITTESCRKAAKEVLAGTRTGSWLFFCINTGTIDGTIIGSQVFY